MAEERIKRKLAAIVSADVVGWSRLMGADEAGTLAALKRHREELIDPKIAEYGGRIVSTAGDSVLVEYPSAVDAVRCSVEIQKAMAERNADLRDNEKMLFRVGVNLGEVILDGDDVFGDGVNIAARLQALAEPGGVCVSGKVYDEVGKNLDTAFHDLGEKTVKNIAQPVRVYAVGASRSESTAPVAPDAAKDALPLPSKPAIAVLPFDNMSGDSEQEYFADGIAEDVITDLSKISGLFVIARNSSFAHKGKAKDARVVCAELGVRYVLEGSVRKAGDRVRISAQLVDGTTGGHLWAERYDRTLDDIFAVQDEVTGNIVRALHLTLSPGERQRVAQREPVNLDAYDCYLKARGQFFHFTKEANAEALRLYEQAFALDASYGLALVGAASCHLREMTQVWSARPERSLEIAKQLADKAIALDASLAEAHTIRGFVLLWQKAHDTALNSLERGINLDPNSAMGHAFFGMALNYVGRSREGVREASMALRLDPQRQPMHTLYHFFLGFGLFLNGAHRDALDALNQSSAVVPDFLPAHLIQAVVLTKLERLDEARAEIAKVRALSPIASLRWMRQRLPFKDPRDLTPIVEAARAAGLPE